MKIAGNQIYNTPCDDQDDRETRGKITSYLLRDRASPVPTCTLILSFRLTAGSGEIETAGHDQLSAVVTSLFSPADRVKPCPYVFIDFVFPTDRRERRNRNGWA